MKSFSAYYQENRNTNPAQLRSLGSTWIHRSPCSLPVSKLTKRRIIQGK